MSSLQILTLVFLIFTHNIYVLCDDEDQLLLDTSCTTNLDCLPYKLPQHNVTCINSECVCNDLNGTQIQCVPDPLVSSVNNIIGGPCPCHQPNSECDPNVTEGGVCFCKKNYSATMDKRRCIKKMLNLNETCEDNSQCIRKEKFSECDLILKVCKCQKNFVEHNGGCISILGLEETCENDLQCSNKTENSICVDRKCACNQGFITNREHSKCLPNADYHEKCEEMDQCKNKLGVGSECYSGHCICDSQHNLIPANVSFNIENYCEKRIEFGDYCREHNHCYEYHLSESLQSMKCFISECVCRPGFIHKDKSCIKSGSTMKFVNKILVILSVILVIGIPLGNNINKNMEF